MKILASSRGLYGSIALLCACFMGYAFYSEYVDGLDPCHLCILQRWAMIGLGLFALIAAVHAPDRLGTRLYAIPTLFFAGLGAAVAGRHVYVQQLPPEMATGCLAPMDMLMANNGLWAAIKKVLSSATGDCALIDWAFLGLTMPAWVLIWFVVFALAIVFRGLLFVPSKAPKWA